MTDEELIAGLRKSCRGGDGCYREVAADRIEALVKEKKALGHMFNATYNRHVAEIIDVETKLAKAVEALRWVNENPWAHPDNRWAVVRDALKELEAKP